jgi:hypothetical protein
MNLLGKNNAKTVKGEKYGFVTHIMYLAPHKTNVLGKNLCPNATVGCINACIFSTGRGSLDVVSNSRKAKSNLFVQDRQAFMMKLYAEILEISLNVGDKNVAIRLNGTSDIPFENIKVLDNKNIFELFPNLTFYDYTKSYKRMISNLPENYFLVFSRSETNDEQAFNLLKMGKNVAFVFDNIPNEYKGYKVVNGDETDLRFRDEKGVIVGLKYKKITYKGADNSIAFKTGFAIKVES